jgi:flagellar assembly factor FliW
MKVESTKFGTLNIDDRAVLDFPCGVIGFPGERRFVAVQRSDMIAFLQSVSTPDLALPVVSVHALAQLYPDVELEPAAVGAGLGKQASDLAVLVVLTALPEQPATVNLMAPVLVNVATRRGAQVFLDGTRFGVRELFVLPKGAEATSAHHQTSEEAAVR